MSKIVVPYSKEDLERRPKTDSLGRKQDYSGLELVVPTDADLEFLRELHLKLNREAGVEAYGHGRLPVWERTIEHYWSPKRETLSTEELKKVLGLIERRGDLTMYPANTNWGFSIGFFIDYTPTAFKSDPKSALRFLEGQLPKSYNFADLAKIFGSEANRQRILAHGLMREGDYKRILDESHFAY